MYFVDTERYSKTIKVLRDKNNIKKIKYKMEYNCDNYENCGNIVKTFISEGEAKRGHTPRRKFYRVEHYLLCKMCHKEKIKTQQEYVNGIEKYEETNLNKCIDRYDFDYKYYTIYNTYIRERHCTKHLCYFCYNNCLDHYDVTLSSKNVLSYRRKKYELCGCRKKSCLFNNKLKNDI